jgi:hypothetical protein
MTGEDGRLLFVKVSGTAVIADVRKKRRCEAGALLM